MASCAAAPPLRVAIEDAPHAFVGTVTETSNDGRWALVAVSEVWSGDAEAVVEVRGGPADPPGPLEAASSVDRTYDEGETYLFVPYGGRGDLFHDNSCSSTSELAEGMEELRPAGAREPRAGEDPPELGGNRSLLWWGGGAAAAAAIAAAAARRRSRP